MNGTKGAKIVIDAFIHGENKKKGNCESKDSGLYLFGHQIARYTDNFDIEISTAGYDTATTIRHLNLFPNTHVCRKKGELLLNDNVWDGDWVKIDF
jgi:uncharacterized protein YcgI (DUF1989 family)